ncbi:MAG: NADP-dependent oxidoreductase [Alphaproteobacteria bacterium]|nr:NADP-dependent oxidoreductase [Alphaproteobacteria bacterium]
MKNRQWLIAARPLGRALKDDDFTFVEGEARQPGDGEVLIRALYLGFDPAQKGWMENIGGYVAPTEIGDVMRGSGIGEVVASRHPDFKAGDKVSGMLCWQDYATIAGRDLVKLEDDELLTANLGALGTTGMTAYFGFLKHGRPQPGDTVIVSGAAGATGSMVGQIAKIMGCRVIGIAGGAEKCRWLVDELGFDAAIDYKAEKKLRSRIHEMAPRGVDVIYDNVGGAILNDMLGAMAMHARVVICGGISRYETGQLPAGPENYFNLIFMRGTMEGFIVLDYMGEYPKARARMRQWIREGKIHFKEDVQSGLENAPRTLMRLFQGQNFGKQILKV